MLGRATVLVVVGLCLLVTADLVARPATDSTTLVQLSEELARGLESRRPQLYYDLLNSTQPAQKLLNENADVQLMYIDEQNRPVYYKTCNLNAARTISTDDVWPGGIGGFALDGTGSGAERMAIFDAGAVYWPHQEFEGRAVQQDSPGSIHYHATHVAGTMVAGGLVTSAKGMSHEAGLSCYDWDADESEMAGAAANGLLVSNHSYATITGWYYNGSEWYWYGDPFVDGYEDWKFGSYRSSAFTWDNIAYNAPHYLIVKAASNERDDDGPPSGTPHQVYYSGSWHPSSEPRDPDGGASGYDCLPEKSTAKNVLTVGAVHDLSGGYSGAANVIAAGFTSWGPTDDGRIKPDIVANGINLYSCGSSSPGSYIYLGGTSMATPNVSGSINLLIQYFESTHAATTPLASTVKAIVIHTADEAGSAPGPDYSFGWGLMNTLKAAQIIQADSAGDVTIVEAPLTEGGADEYYIDVDGTQPLRFTVAWTDRPGTPADYGAIDDPTPKLVNDLDLRVEHMTNGTTYQPYILDLYNPASAATTGDNYRDNVEQIYIEAPEAGKYTVRVSHKGVIAGSQYYSLIVPDAFIVPCCGVYDPDNLSGNVDYDPEGFKEISDILKLARYALQGGDTPVCLAEANTDGDADCFTDITDILRLARYALQGGEAPAECIIVCE
jgi:hypothetical protein